MLLQIPEVAGDAALLFDPRQPEELAVKLTDVLSHQRLVSDLVVKGLKEAVAGFFLGQNSRRDASSIPICQRKVR